MGGITKVFRTSIVHRSEFLPKQDDGLFLTP
jgi:hypothetical protein